MNIAGREIGLGWSPYVIAEMSANHNGRIESAFRIIEEAKKAGADAIKIQTYRADTVTLNCDSEDFQIKGGLWDGFTLYKLYEWAHTPWEWHSRLFEHARKIGITIFSSPFDSTAVDLLEDLNAPAYKIASFEVVDLPLIKYVANTGKPMIISTGMASIEEIQDAVSVARSAGATELALLHCVSAYPAPVREINLAKMNDMASRFGVVVGLSDHTLGTTTSISAIARGASIIEKHFTLSRDEGGMDCVFSLEPHEMVELVKEGQLAYEAIGNPNYEIRASEKTNLIFRRSLFVVEDIRVGEMFSGKNIRCIRPGYGMAPKFICKVLGRNAARDLKRGEPLSADMIDGFMSV